MGTVIAASGGGGRPAIRGVHVVGRVHRCGIRRRPAIRGSVWATGLRAARAQPPIAWRLLDGDGGSDVGHCAVPDRVEASGNGGEIRDGPCAAADRATVHAAPRAPSSCTATLTRVPGIAVGCATLAAPSCKRCVNVNPDRASGSLPGPCKCCMDGNPDCMFGSASALNLVV